MPITLPMMNPHTHTFSGSVRQIPLDLVPANENDPSQAQPTSREFRQLTRSQVWQQSSKGIASLPFLSPQNRSPHKGMQDASIAKRGWNQDGHPQDGFDGAASSARRFPSRAEAGKAHRYNTFSIDGCRCAAQIRRGAALVKEVLFYPSKRKPRLSSCSQNLGSVSLTPGASWRGGVGFSFKQPPSIAKQAEAPPSS